MCILTIDGVLSWQPRVVLPDALLGDEEPQTVQDHT